MAVLIVLTFVWVSAGVPRRAALATAPLVEGRLKGSAGTASALLEQRVCV